MAAVQLDRPDHNPSAHVALAEHPEPLVVTELELLRIDVQHRVTLQGCRHRARSTLDVTRHQAEHAAHMHGHNRAGRQ